MLKTLIRVVFTILISYAFFKFSAPIVSELIGPMKLIFIAIVILLFIIALSKIWEE